MHTFLSVIKTSIIFVPVSPRTIGHSRRVSPQLGFVRVQKNNIVIPEFDRKKDLSIAGSSIISKKDRVLIVEGNYLLVEEKPWAELNKSWDQTIFINPGIDILEHRLLERWFTYGLDSQIAKNRVLNNDLPNARYVIEKSSNSDIQISKF